MIASRGETARGMANRGFRLQIETKENHALHVDDQTVMYGWLFNVRTLVLGFNKSQI
jgi:hypothetical protein